MFARKASARKLEHEHTHTHTHTQNTSADAGHVLQQLQQEHADDERTGNLHERHLHLSLKVLLQERDKTQHNTATSTRIPVTHTHTHALPNCTPDRPSPLPLTQPCHHSIHAASLLLAVGNKNGRYPLLQLPPLEAKTAHPHNWNILSLAACGEKNNSDKAFAAATLGPPLAVTFAWHGTTDNRVRAAFSVGACLGRIAWQAAS